MRLKLTIERLKRNATQKEISEAIGISSQRLSSYETGKITPNFATMKKISKFYRKPIEELFSMEVDENE